MSTLNCGVIETGYFGKFHAEKHARITDCKLVTITDIKEKTCREVVATHSTASAAGYPEPLGKLDAVSVATPTATHQRIARDFLEGGARTLIKKPMVVSLDETDEPIEVSAHERLSLTMFPKLPVRDATHVAAG